LELDLTINSRRLVALDTKDSEDAAYYGTAFINGSASITGPTNGLLLKLAASSERVQRLKSQLIMQKISENSFIHFLSPKKNTILKWVLLKTRNYKD
jgi:hypothetical protein